MKAIQSLEQHLLVATRSWNRTIFEKSLVYLYRQQDKQLTGIMVNKPLNPSLDRLMKELGIDLSTTLNTAFPLLLGGPTDLSQGFVLFRHLGRQQKDLLDQEGRLTSSVPEELLDQLKESQGQENCLVTVGSCQWTVDELHHEIADGKWLVTEYDEKILFDTPFERRYEEAMTACGCGEGGLFGGGSGRA